MTSPKPSFDNSSKSKRNQSRNSRRYKTDSRDVLFEEVGIMCSQEIIDRTRHFSEVSGASMQKAYKAVLTSLEIHDSYQQKVESS